MVRRPHRRGRLLPHRACTPPRLQHFLADPAADGTTGSGGGGSGGDGGGGSGGGSDAGGGAGDQGGSAEDSGSGTDPGVPSGEEPDTKAELQKCLKRAYKIGNKKKRHKAVKKCRQQFG